MTIEIPISPVEKLRRERGLSQRQLAALLYCTDIVIAKAERGIPIMQKYIDRFVAWGAGTLLSSHFIRARPPKEITDGKKTSRRKKDRKRSKGRTRKVVKGR